MRSRNDQPGRRRWRRSPVSQVSGRRRAGADWPTSQVVAVVASGALEAPKQRRETNKPSQPE